MRAIYERAHVTDGLSWEDHPMGARHMVLTVTDRGTVQDLMRNDAGVHFVGWWKGCVVQLGWMCGSVLGCDQGTATRGECSFVLLDASA